MSIYFHFFNGVNISASMCFMMTPEGNTVDFFDDMGVPLPAYARRQFVGNETRRFDFGQAS